MVQGRRDAHATASRFQLDSRVKLGQPFAQPERKPQSTGACDEMPIFMRREVIDVR